MQGGRGSATKASAAWVSHLDFRTARLGWTTGTIDLSTAIPHTYALRAGYSRDDVALEDLVRGG